ELVAQPLVVARFDRLQDFVGLLEQVRLERFVRLLAVPGTAVGLAQAMHDVEDRGQPRTVRPPLSALCQRFRFFHGPRARPWRPGTRAAPGASPRPAGPAAAR